MKKTIISTVAVFSMLTGVAVANTSFFKDVPASAWYAPAVAEVSSHGIMQGNSDGTFSPDSYVTRAELAQIISNTVHYVNSEPIEEDKLLQSVAKAVPATVMVFAYKASGSGFFVDQGKIITNWHVVNQNKIGDDVQIILSNLQLVEGKIEKTDEKRDLALISVNMKDKVSTLGFATGVSVGETVMAVGAPFGTAFSVTKGVVSNSNRVFGDYKFIQIDAPINHGNSGGPIVDINGNLVAVASQKLAGPEVEGIGFGIPFEDVQKFLK